MNPSTQTLGPFGIDEIRCFLPHRYPFLLVDRVLEISGFDVSQDPAKGTKQVGMKIHGIKNVSYSEPCFTGHFPDRSIFPGVLIVEAIAQTAAFACYPFFVDEIKAGKCKIEFILAGIDEVRFRKPVVPGDVLNIEATLTKQRGRLLGFDAVAKVGGDRVVEAKILAMWDAKKQMES